MPMRTNRTDDPEFFPRCQALHVSTLGTATGQENGMEVSNARLSNLCLQRLKSARLLAIVLPIREHD
jgi:hypothetical protein